MQGAQASPRKVPVDSVVGELCMSLNEKVCIKVVLKGMKQDRALSVAGAIQAHKERFLPFLPLCAATPSFAI